MDLQIFGLSLLAFAVLYLALTVFLLWAIIITLILILVFFAARWGGAKDYPHGFGDTLTLLVLITITWALFIFLGPKNPLPVVGKTLTYSSPDWGLVIAVAIFFSFAILCVFAVISHGKTETPVSSDSSLVAQKL